ncbi:MAG TPA: hypothetical protein DGT21_26055 [Armatimonadetes bacterium]|nr:hypothetical protein [Armatimonadota bacterium]
MLDRPLTVTLEFDGETYGFPADSSLTITSRTEDGPGDTAQKPCAFEMEMTLPAYGALAYEIVPRG